MVDPNVKIDKATGLPMPFVEGVKSPDQKMYLLLLVRQYPGIEDTEKQWIFILGRSQARQWIIENIDTIDAHASRVLVEGIPLSEEENLPTIYTLFTDPRSSWTDEQIYNDGFNIDEHCISPQDYYAGDPAEPTAVDGQRPEDIEKLMSGGYDTSDI